MHISLTTRSWVTDESLCGGPRSDLRSRLMTELLPRWLQFWLQKIVRALRSTS